MINDTTILDTLARETVVVQSVVSEAHKTAVTPSPLLWILLVAVVIIGIVILVLLLSKGVRGRGKTSADHYLDGLRALLDGDEVTAARELRDTVMADTDNIDAYIRLGRLMRAKGDAERAAQIHQSLTARPSLSKKDEQRIYEEVLEDYLMLGRTEKSIALLREMVGLSPSRIDHLRRLLSLLASLGRTHEIIEVLKQYRKVFKDKDEPAVWFAHVARLLVDKDEEAEDALRQAQKVSKNHPYILVVQAESLIRKEQWGKARAILDRFIKLYPQHAEHVLDMLEKTYFEEGAYAKLEPLYENLNERYPSKHEVMLRLVKLYLKQGETDNALEMINDGLGENPSDAVLLMELVRLKLAQQDLSGIEEAFDHVEQILFVIPNLCAECGSELEPAAWICPSCGSVVSKQ